MGNTSSVSSPRVTPQDKAILQMKLQRDKLIKTQTRLSVIMNKEKQIAIEALQQNNKQRALLALKKKKYQESSINRINDQLISLENLINSIEFKLIEKDFLYGLEQGNKILTQLNKEVSIEKVDKLMDTTQEGIRYQQEVDDMLSQRLNRSEEMEVDEELKELERQELGLPEVKKEPKELSELSELPEVPKTDIEEEPVEELPEQSIQKKEREREEELLAS
ncbi:hypothetical protein PACTADRAFT_41862 [Pachysolen tannophilus NRRL Y-2460]|uniref:Vacuolar protein sorting-associated protein 20 n=1 Tax=Pachysolen tannophilus NRRL Y-2460 TaxID=669874 RepID=A0A1E4TVH8_PACTA|nr:hypothetical protein PACTADRAFT_41862 [Pachysolen tannophilus NRRL Y-2460]